MFDEVYTLSGLTFHFIQFQLCHEALQVSVSASSMRHTLRARRASLNTCPFLCQHSQSCREAPRGHVPTDDTLQHTVLPHTQNIFFPSFCLDYAISKPDLMSQMERGERPAMQEQEDSEEGETPTDPSAGEWQIGGLGPCILSLSVYRQLRCGALLRSREDLKGCYSIKLWRKEACR